MRSSWYLQHVTTGQRHILYNGHNLVGRHSRCRIVLAGTYQFVSREHANIIVSDNEVVVQSMVRCRMAPEYKLFLIFL